MSAEDDFEIIRVGQKVAPKPSPKPAPIVPKKEEPKPVDTSVLTANTTAETQKTEKKLPPAPKQDEPKPFEEEKKEMTKE